MKPQGDGRVRCSAWLGRVVCRSEIMSKGHRASRDANTHDEIPDEREWPKQRAPDKQTERPVGQPRPVTPQMNVGGIKGSDASGAEGDHSGQDLPRRNGERSQDARDQNDGNPTFGGECGCVLHGVRRVA